jgi:hypothetical protein
VTLVGSRPLVRRCPGSSLHVPRPASPVGGACPSSLPRVTHCPPMCRREWEPLALHTVHRVRRFAEGASLVASGPKVGVGPSPHSPPRVVCGGPRVGACALIFLSYSTFRALAWLLFSSLIWLPSQQVCAPWLRPGGFFDFPCRVGDTEGAQGVLSCPLGITELSGACEC